MMPDKTAEIELRTRPAQFRGARKLTEDERNEHISYENFTVGFYTDALDRVIFGLVSPFGGEMTHMSYELDEDFVSETARKGLYFDAGATRRELMATGEEMLKVYKELGLIND